MDTSTVSSREFNQDTGRAKKAALRGPVIITDRGEPSHVLLSVEHYRALLGEQPTIGDLLASPGAETITLRPHKLRRVVKPAEFD